MEELELTDQVMMKEEDLISMAELCDTQLTYDDAEFPLEFLEPELDDTVEKMPPQISEAQPSKGRKRKLEVADKKKSEVGSRKKSIVWKYFTIVEEDVVQGSSSPVVAKSMRAVCRCGKSYAYGNGSKVIGTSHLKRHITNGKCSFILNNPEEGSELSFSTAPPPKVVTQSSTRPPNTPRRRRGQTSKVLFDADKCRRDICTLIIMQGYPLHMVEHPFFVSLIQTLHPRFGMVSFNNVEGDCIATYLEQKHAIQKLIDAMPGKICLTIDLWSSRRTIGYFFVTGQFFDSECRIHRKLLNVIREPFPDSPEAFSKAVAACLSDWNLDGKLFSMTINQPLSDSAANNLRALLSGQYLLLVGNCLARSLGDTVKTAFTFAHDIVKKVRDSVKYVKTSELREERFQELKQQLQVPSLKCLSIDDQTKWNTTYEMLLSASELKEVFSCLDTLDYDYKTVPSAQDWKLIELLCSYLKPLFETANLLTTATSQKAYTFFHEAWKIQVEMALAVSSQDPFVRELTKVMREEFDKYWKSCCCVLAIAVVMDPRFKMKLVEFNFSKIYGEEAGEYVKEVNKGIQELFLDYMSLPLLDEANGMVCKTDDNHKEIPCNGVGLMEFDEYAMETKNQISMSELDAYLEESLLPREGEFDVIGWWKMNQKNYPTLSKMACDVLSIPVCTVPASSVFDTARKEMDNYRCDLRPETLEAIICAKDWIQ